MSDTQKAVIETENMDVEADVSEEMTTDRTIQKRHQRNRLMKKQS